MSDTTTVESSAYNGIPPFVADSDTSLDAALAMAPNAATLRAEVLRFFVARGERGATDDEAQVQMPMDPSTERPRRIELWRGGFLVRTDQRRKTRAGHWAGVYEVTDLGLAWAALNTSGEGLEP